MRKWLLLTLLAGVLPAADSWSRDLEQWRARREAGLKAEGGWLSVTGLFWLREGANTLGTGAGSVVLLPEGTAAPRAGVIELRGGRITAIVDGTRRELRPDSPDVLAFGPVKLTAIRRGDRYGIRMRDGNSQYLREFTGLRWFPPAPSWRVKARFVSQPRKLPIPNVLGQIEDRHSPGYAEFAVGGRTLRLHPVMEGDDTGQLFFIFKDLTSGKETYGAGRFLYTGLPRDGFVVLDFNRAYNPPCAFTPYATCPLPPRENRLPVRVTAGELTYGGH